MASLFARARAKYRRWKLDPARNLAAALGRRADATVVQIGSNDGATDDPVHTLLRRRPQWRALFVEPVPFLFERLRANYGNAARFRFENVAVGDRVGVQSFYYVDPAARAHVPDLPFWFDQLGSFDPEHIRRHLGAAVERFVVRVDLATVPLAALLERNGIDRIDLLHIDTEGADWLILRQLDLARFRPAAILFEHKHLSASDKAAALAFVQSGYRVTDLGCDFFCRRRRGT